MDAVIDLTGYAHALGRAQAAWRFAGTDLRRASGLASISAAWDIFRRDAGAGAVGPAHQAAHAPSPLLFTEDPRRDAFLLWLADYCPPALAEAAAALAHMVGATRRFSIEEQALLDTARGALARPITGPKLIRKFIGGAGQTDNAVLEPLYVLTAAVDRLRGDAGFLEGAGDEVNLALPTTTLTHYVPAEPAGCWALNLALLVRGVPPVAGPPAPGLVARASFRSNLASEEIAARVVDDATAGWNTAYDQLSRLEPELARGREALAHLSRNARTRDAWLLVAALGACTRVQLARALGLSRAGADIQAHALDDAGLVTLAAGGQIAWAPAQARKTEVSASLEQGPLRGAVSDLDASLAEIDRLLARSAR